MAQSTDATGDVVANRPSVAEPVGSADELVRQAPDPTDEGGKVYRVAYPTDQFVVEGQPVVNTTGVRLTADQAETILAAADASGVKIVEVED